MSKRKKDGRARKGTGSVFENPRKRGHYIGTATIDGKKHRIYAETKEQAEEELAELIRLGVPERPTLTVRVLLHDWLATDVAGRDRAPSTENRYRWAAHKLDAQIGSILVPDLSVRDVERALTNMLPLSKASLRQIQSTLSQALSMAVRRDDVIRDVAALAMLPGGAAAAVKRKSLSRTDARCLLDVFDGNSLLFALMLQCGLRPGEAAGLYWSALDLDEGSVTVSRGTRSDRGRTSVVDSVKIASAYRSIGLPPGLTAALRAHRGAQKIERIAAASWANSRLVFATETGTPIDSANMRRQLTAICEQAGLAAVTPNELRHSFTSYLSDEGIPHETIADVLGHTSTRMLEATYRHRPKVVMDVTATIDWSEQA